MWQRNPEYLSKNLEITLNPLPPINIHYQKENLIRTKQNYKSIKGKEDVVSNKWEIKNKCMAKGVVDQCIEIRLHVSPSFPQMSSRVVTSFHFQIFMYTMSHLVCFVCLFARFINFKNSLQLYAHLETLMWMKIGLNECSK